MYFFSFIKRVFCYALLIRFVYEKVYRKSRSLLSMCALVYILCFRFLFYFFLNKVRKNKIYNKSILTYYLDSPSQFVYILRS